MTDATAADAPSTIAGFAIHPAADLFPLILGADFDAFVADVEANGQMEDVVLDTSRRIVDGRNRARACERLGIAVRTSTYAGPDVVQYVVSHNLHRRHLTDSQRAMIAARLATRGNGEHAHAVYLDHMIELPPTLGQAATLLQVGTANVGRAKRVIRDGTKALADAAAEGLVPVATAARVAAELRPAEQDAYVAEIRGGASPLRSAPPTTAPREGPRPGANRRKHLGQLDAILTGLSGYVAAFDGVANLDSSVTAGEAARLTSDLSKQIRALSRINQLLKERTCPPPA